MDRRREGWEIEARRTYRVTVRGPAIVADTTPNPGWDANGHLYLMLEEHGEKGMTLAHLIDELRLYNAENRATMPTDVADVREGLGWLIGQGMVERIQ